MANTTMEKITSIAKKLKNNASGIPHLANLTLSQGEIFSWSHTARAITYDVHMSHADAYLLHEYGHALLVHASYTHDIDLLKMERAAWDKALEIAPMYGVSIDDDLVEDALDTYRDWLHDRSLCPTCGATGLQIESHTYRCFACFTTWSVNEARGCTLRRYTKKRP